MNNKLLSLFSQVQQESRELRLNGSKDGQSYWQNEWKGTLAKYDKYIVEWKDITMPDLPPEFDDNGNIIELNHFLIQQYRIPNVEKANVRKVVQLALNIGQYEGSIGAPLSDHEENLKKYINQESINYLNLQI